MSKTTKVKGIAAVALCCVTALTSFLACGGKKDVPAGDSFTVAKYNATSALEDYPLLVGGHAHGAVNIQTLNDLGMGNFVWIPKYGYGMGNTPWNSKNGYREDVDTALANDMYYMVSSKRGLGQNIKKGGMTAGGDTSVLYPLTQAERDIVKSGGKYFVGYHAEELDIDLRQCGIYPAFQDRLSELFDFQTKQEARVIYETELERLQDEANEMGGRFISNQSITHQLNAFRAGNDIVICEMLEHLPNTQMQLAYLRGGRQQFGGDWGVWMSPWADGVPTADKSLWPNENARVGHGHSASSFKVTMYESYVSGARIITQQETEPLFAKEIGGGFKDVLWGTELKNFWAYAKDHQEYMNPSSNFAVMIDRDNGWEPGNLWTNWAYEDKVWSKLQPQKGDIMQDKFFDTFLPGYKRTPESAASHTDLYPGFFASTPVGPFDVVASDADASRLMKYPTIIMMGDVTMNETVMETLKAYVNGGGTLVINAYQSMDESGSKFYEDTDFFGYQFSRFSENWRISDRLNGCATITLQENMPYMPATTYSDWTYAVNGVTKGASVVAYDDNRNPVVVRNDYGRGQVYLTLTEYMMSAFNNPYALDFYKDFLKALVLQNRSYVKVFPSATDGTIDYSYVTAFQGDDDLVVCVTGYADAGGYVDVVIADDSISEENVSVDVGGNGTCEVSVSDGTTTVRVHVDQMDVTLLRVKVS